MLDDVRLALMLHHQHMLKHDLAAIVFDNPHDFVAAGGLFVERGVAGIPACRFLHVKAHFEIARHRENVGTVGGKRGGLVCCRTFFDRRVR